MNTYKARNMCRESLFNLFPELGQYNRDDLVAQCMIAKAKSFIGEVRSCYEDNVICSAIIDLDNDLQEGLKAGELITSLNRCVTKIATGENDVMLQTRVAHFRSLLPPF